MNIDKVNMTIFGAGNVQLTRIAPESVSSLKAIKKIAEDKGMDIFISKNKESKFLPKEDMFLILATKERPIITRGFFEIGKETQHGANITILNKDINKKDFGIKIYNATMNAIEALENKLKK